MEFRPTTQEDLDYVAEHSVSRGIQKYSSEQADYCYTLIHEGTPFGLGGFRLINCTTAWCWVDITQIGHENIAITYRTLKEWIDIFAKEHELRRLQAYVECDFTEAIRMVTHLGFKREGPPMEKFIGDRDAFMYVRII